MPMKYRQKYFFGKLSSLSDIEKKDGTRGVLKMDNVWHLYGKFTGDVIGGKITIQESGAEFYGKMNVAELEVYKSAFAYRRSTDRMSEH